MNNKECIPNTTSDSKQVYINNNGVNYVCVKTSNEIGSTDIVCEQYKLDTQEPVFASTTVYFDKGDIKLTNLLVSVYPNISPSLLLNPSTKTN